MKKISKILIVAGALLLLKCNPFADSAFSNCVVVEDEKHYNGKFLKHSKAKEWGPKKTEKCIAIDKAIDNGDGPKKGKVRWIVCGIGPDCHEAGMH